MIRIAFTGTQRGLTPRQLERLHQYVNALQQPGLIVAKHGGCVGGDDEFDKAVAGRGIFRRIHPSNIKGKSVSKSVLLSRGRCHIFEEKPPLKRNPDVLRDADTLVACPKEDREVLRSGTWATIRLARKMGIPIVMVWP